MKINDEYLEFLETKKKVHIESGFDIDENQLNPLMFDFQKFCVKKALKAGKYALFEDCGLGKTIQQLEWANQVLMYTQKPVLILCPLAVSAQTIKEGEKFGVEVKKYSLPIENKIYISNYEQIENIDCSLFSGIVLDESSILKNFEGKTRNKIISGFANTKYKLCCSATPSPNDPIELGSQAEFLNVMSRNEMLSKFFVHDSGDTAKWRIKGHAVGNFYKWVSTWAVMMNNPNEIGFNQTNFKITNLLLNEVKIQTKKQNNGLLFNDIAVNATNFNAELRRSMDERIQRVSEIVKIHPDDQCVIWIKHDVEGQKLRQLIPDAIEVKGSDSTDYKEQKFFDFANKKFNILITKQKIGMFGMNWQNCNNVIFASLDFSFEAFYQSIRRFWRYGQTKDVNVWFITTDTMLNVIESIRNKQNQFKIMQDEMNTFVNENFKNEIKIIPDSKVYKNDFFELRKGDCVQLIKEVQNESIDFSVFSPPFADLYTYSDSIEDFGNCSDYNEFVNQFKFLCKELFRVIKQGRNVAIHCMDLPIQKGKEGVIGLRDFSGMIRQSMENEGFMYHSRITIWKNPVTEMQRTKALGLLHKQTKKDATMCRVGLPDYVLVFRKDGERSNPVKLDLPVDLWQKLASPVWMDIEQGNTLQREVAREEKDEKHICPLQLDTIKNLVYLYTNPSDLVLSPFAGIGSEIYQSVLMDRKGIGFELKQSYFNVAIKNCLIASESKKQLKLFE